MSLTDSAHPTLICYSPNVPLSCIIQLLQDAEPLSAKLFAYLINTRAAEFPRFPTQGEVNNSHLRNVNIVAVLTLSPVVPAHPYPIVIITGGVRTFRRGVPSAAGSLYRSIALMLSIMAS